ncbi:MAG: polysaccharide export protein [Acidobacteriia bacterium]|nr:polysaccharide export protein [Terriglobia bacterium]
MSSTKWFLILAGALALGLAWGQPNTAASDAKEYVLGPDDVLKIWVLGVDEIGETPIRIDSDGWISLPLAGRVRAGGLTVEQLRLALTEKLKSEIRNPRVSVAITEFGSQPVAIVGAVNAPGVHQLRGRKTLAEVVASAGGLRPDAGAAIRISRPVESGVLPLDSATLSEDKKFNVAEVKTKDFLDAKNPGENILIQPHDVVTVPTAEMIYVIGAVHKPGAFVLHERETMSALQVLSMAEGLGPTPAPGESKILRTIPGSTERKEIALDLKKILAGKAEDIALRPNDILFVPTSNGKRIAVRAMEAAITAGTGLVIFR